VKKNHMARLMAALAAGTAADHALSVFRSNPHGQSAAASIGTPDGGVHATDTTWTPDDAWSCLASF
jgi:hypothetical protein